MSIINYIAEKKARFKNKIEANRNKSIAKKESRLKELEIKNRVKEQDLKLQRELRVEEQRSRDLTKEKIRSSIAGRITGNIKQKYSEQKTQQRRTLAGNSGNIWTQQSSYNNPFNSKQGFGSAPFSKGTAGRNVFSSSGAERNISKAKKKRVVRIEYE
ncbi:MAG: hypothetical protein ACP5N3_04200 [Candidatus Nanoarchaeia archaeon]